MRSGRYSLLTALLTATLLAPLCPARAERASESEMLTVTRNYLIESLHRTGSWGGSAQPQVGPAHEIRVDGEVVARYYDIEPSGFVLVPALKEMVPIKAYSEDARLDELQSGGFLALIEETMAEWAQHYVELYGSLDAPQPTAGDALFGRGQKALWDRYLLPEAEFTAQLSTKKPTRAEAGPLLTSAWHQRAPYNAYCPEGDSGRTCVVGCVATATAQILNYYQWPPSGTGTHSYYWHGDYSCGGNSPGGLQSADYTDPYDWVNMADSCGGEWTPEQEAALAELSYEAGVAFNMSYGACGSGASTSQAAVVFPTYFKYKGVTEVHYRGEYDLAGWFTLIQDEINENRPIQYRIRSHSIVCDGWRESGETMEYHMNYGWGGSFNAWYVLDSLFCSWVLPDSVCPADEEFMVTNIMPASSPILEARGRSVTMLSGDGDSHWESNEMAQLTLTLHNLGNEATGITGEISSLSPYISVVSGAAAFGATPGFGGTTINATPFVVAASPGCPDPHVAALRLDITADDDYASADTILLFVGDVSGFTDDMESGEGDWMSSPVKPFYQDQWRLGTERRISGQHARHCGASGGGQYAAMLDAGLVTPPFLLGNESTLRFWHWIEAEDDGSGAFDGGIVMIAGYDGVWTQLTPAGGYSHTVLSTSTGPFESGTPCFSGSQDWKQEEVDLSAYSGVVQIMFRFGSDGYVGGEGWYVDDVEIVGTGCCVGDRGNVDGSTAEALDVADLVYLVNYMFKSGPEAPCFDEANVDATAELDITDLIYLVNYMFKEGAAPLPCP